MLVVAMTTAPRRPRAAAPPAPPRYLGAALPRPESRRRGDLEHLAVSLLPQTWSVPGPRRYRGSFGWGQGAPAGGGDPEMASPSPPGRVAPGRARGARGRGDLEVVVARRGAGPGGAPGLPAAPRSRAGVTFSRCRPGGGSASPSPQGRAGRAGCAPVGTQRTSLSWGWRSGGESPLFPAPRLPASPSGDGGCQRLRSGGVKGFGAVLC